MTIQQFIEKYNGQYVEVAGSANAQNQCVDLVNAYLRDVLSHTIVEWTNARDFPAKLTDFDWIQNTPDGVPQEGDIVVWQNNSVGHIAIFIEGSSSSFRSFDQNYPTGSPSHVQSHTYIAQMCWGRPKASLQAELDKTRVERDRNWNYFAAICDKLKITTNIDLALTEIEKLLTYEDIVRQKDKQLSEAEQQIQALKDSTQVKEGEYAQIKDEVKVLQDKINGLVEDNQIHIKEIEQLKQNVNQPTLSGWKLIVYKLIQKI